MTERDLFQKEFAPVDAHRPQPFLVRRLEREGSGQTPASDGSWVGAIERTMRAVAGDGEVAVTFVWRARVSHFLSSLPLWLLIALIVVVPTALAMIAQVLIRRWVGIETLVKNNEIAGFKFATVGVIYAVLLAFSVIVVWEKFNDAQTSVAEEAGATAALFRYADGNEPEAVALRAALVNYLKAAIDEEWPAMGLESEAHGVTQALNRLYSAAMALNQSGTRDTADMSEVFRQIDNVTAARRIRLHLATGLVPDVIWIALFAGALLTIGFTLFFGSENLLAQVSMTGVLSLLVTLGLVVIISLDHPFTGPVYIHADALSGVLEEFGKPPG
jgi:hypothetical protein